MNTVFLILFSTKNGKLFMHFGHSFTQQLCIEGLKMQTFKNSFQSARFNLTLLNSRGRVMLPKHALVSLHKS